jgi:hypothetical protein
MKRMFSGAIKNLLVDIRGSSHTEWMFESTTDIVYFHNFNKLESENLWYRLNAAPLVTMRCEIKKMICFTNPGQLWILNPTRRNRSRVDASGWYRDDREVNIHVSEARWRELDGVWTRTSFAFRIKRLLLANGGEFTVQRLGAKVTRCLSQRMIAAIGKIRKLIAALYVRNIGRNLRFTKQITNVTRNAHVSID